MARCIPLLALCACADPVSNQLFYEDAVFVEALPGAERLAAPAVLMNATAGDSALQRAAIEQAELVDGFLTPVALSADTLRTTSPDTRTDVFRSWNAVPVVGDGGARWWVRGEVGRADDDQGVSTWQIEWSATADGDWQVLAVGQHTSSASGTFVIQVEDVDAVRQVGARYGLESTGEPNLELGIGLGPVQGDLYWKVVGDATLVWTGLFDVGAPTPRPGAAMVVQDLDGGRGEAFTSGDQPARIAACWDGGGNVVWNAQASGDESGTEAQCVVGPLFE